MSRIHYSNYGSVEEAIVGFSKFCRDNDLNIGLSHTQEALKTAHAGFLGSESTLQFALKSLFCTCTEDHETFDRCFYTFWHKKKHNYSPTTSRKNRSNIAKKSKSSLVMMGFNPNGKKERQVEDEAHNVSGASKIEALRQTDFSKVAAIDSDLLDELADKLIRQLNHRLKRRLEKSKKGKIDIRRTIRGNLSNGDDLISLFRKNRKLEKYRIILLLDVSGSMDKYSFFLLKFIWSLKMNVKQIEAFAFSTKLVRITDMVNKESLDDVLWQMSIHADNWSSGTRIGDCLASFNDAYSKRMLNGRSVTIVLSDGLDVGEPELLEQEVKKIKMRTSKLVWLNPLKGMQGYEPIARGMQVALPSLDTFASAHNLDSLLELENILADA